jgi:hypothetical protein
MINSYQCGNRIEGGHRINSEAPAASPFVYCRTETRELNLANDQ